MNTTSTETIGEQALALARVRALAQSGRAREVRLAAQLSLYDVAGAIGSTASSVLRWEQGVRRPYGEPALRYGSLLEALARQIENSDAPREEAGASRKEGDAGAVPQTH
jgi:transcriptional regulator with XRE-family HTH domain